jgi:hypothetical protein
MMTQSSKKYAHCVIFPHSALSVKSNRQIQIMDDDDVFFYLDFVALVRANNTH